LTFLENICFIFNPVEHVVVNYGDLVDLVNIFKLQNLRSLPWQGTAGVAGVEASLQVSHARFVGGTEVREYTRVTLQGFKDMIRSSRYSNEESLRPRESVQWS
jgi:hypothetical protein